MNLASEIDELKETQRQLTEAARGLAGPALIDAMMQGELGVQRDAMINAPVDTGSLRSSIVAETPVIEGGMVVGVVGTAIEYAPFQEFGTYDKGAPKGIAPRLFFTGAWEKNRDRVIALLQGAAFNALRGG